jgi:twinkle protein
MLVHELNIHLFMVSHSKRPNGKSHEEGGQTSLSELRGTAGIGQLSDTVLGLERNGQSEDERERTTTLIRVLKNRFAGITGPASYLKFHKETYRLSETVAPDLQTAEITDEEDRPIMESTRFNSLDNKAKEI